MKSLPTYLQIQLYNGRWTWRPMLVTGIFVPLLSMVLVVAARGGARDPSIASYVVTGAVTMALVFECLSRVAQNCAFMKASGAYDFYRSTSGGAEGLLVATVVSFFLLALPSMVVCLVVGSMIYGVQFHPSPWALLAVPLASGAACSMGAVIGLSARAPETSSTYALTLTTFSVFLGSVFIPASELPAGIRMLSWLSPGTYASAAVRQSLVGNPTPFFFASLVVLGVVCVGGLAISIRKVDSHA